jgi:hypothetical protein
LNAIWSSTRETLHNISLSSYVDNARRERSAWIGTELIHAWRGGYAVEGDLELARKTLCDALDFGDLMDGVVPAKALGNTPKSWLRQFDCHDLHFPRTARDYLWHSDDRELAPRLLRACERLLEHHGERTKAGLKPLVGAWSWSGWTFCAAGSVITAHNLQLVDALRATAQVFRYQGDEDSAEALLQQEEPLVEAIFRELLDGTHGVLCQGLDAEGRRVPFCSQQDNARALALGIVPEAWVERFHHFASGRSGTWPTNRSAWQGKTISGDLIRSQPEQMVVAGCQLDSLVVVEAIARLESPEAALNYIRQHWGAMVDEGPGTQWECWNQHFIEEHTSCFSQSWGTAVAFQILQFALGVEVAKPGGIEIRWKPKRVRIREISARIRTKKGEVTLGWSANELHWKVPAGVRLVIEHAESPQQTLEGPITHNL